MLHNKDTKEQTIKTKSENKLKSLSAALKKNLQRRRKNAKRND